MPKRPFNNPFGKLPRPPAEPPRPEPKPAQPVEAPPAPADDDTLWTQATTGVKPMEQGSGFVVSPPPHVDPGIFFHPDLEAIDALRAIVSGDQPFDLADTDEFIEGRVAGLDQAIVRRLRRGDYAVQGHIDLHGLTREEAKQALDHFLREARKQGKRCVLVVHGRGIHSKDQIPVLKEALRTWLATARFGRHVLAFASARQVDGGAGAIYVLLRRAGR